MMLGMKNVLPLVLCLMLAAQQAFAGPTVEKGPLSPCAPPQAEASSVTPSARPAYAWGVEIATSFSKQEALDQFARVKHDHANLLGSYDPMVVETCDLHMGTDLQYSVRIGTDSREDADNLCAKLQADGGACIVQKN
ncbi:MAG: SPOR domain-containing protein [Methyloceanibacter sp.]